MHQELLGEDIISIHLVNPPPYLMSWQGMCSEGQEAMEH